MVTEEQYFDDHFAVFLPIGYSVHIKRSCNFNNESW